MKFDRTNNRRTFLATLWALLFATWLAPKLAVVCYTEGGIQYTLLEGYPKIDAKDMRSVTAKESYRIR